MSMPTLWIACWAILWERWESGNFENTILCYDCFVSAIVSAADLYIPIKHSIQNWMYFNLWWDQECSDSVDRRKSIENSYAACTIMENYIKYKRRDAKLDREKEKTWFVLFLCIP